ncbi:hypothetical protein AR1Y2_0474 [Anaerostipes rhamnosivorans]|uniref:Uncharacterized protein n=1 Tax=Anaerostipes rhamnosivorans TaxID=1229621 RepID=A0A4P8I8U6_9FIRM|nr:hypothetical protein AR1Y2_0474 [Anaerostipes rhamnosivorans]
MTAIRIQTVPASPKWVIRVKKLSRNGVLMCVWMKSSI